MGNDELITVRERLERLKKNPKKVPKPLDVILPEREHKPVSEGSLTSEKIHQKKVEKVIKRIESIKEKMKTSETFINYFYDLKQAEKEFLTLLETAEEKHIDFSDEFAERIKEVKNKIRTKIR